MDYERSRAILSSLANGVDPRSGEVFSYDSPYQAADVIRALYVALGALDAKSSRTKRLSANPRNAGQPWKEDEDRRLLEQFDAGASVEEIAKLHERTVPGIQARLERHGRWTRPLDVTGRSKHRDT